MKVNEYELSLGIATGGFSGTYTATTNSIFNSKIGTEKNNVSMAEWSNAIDLRSISFGSAGSNPAWDNLIHIFFTLAVAQLVERSTVVVISDRMVPGSNPGGEKKSWWCRGNMTAFQAVAPSSILGQDIIFIVFFLFKFNHFQWTEMFEPIYKTLGNQRLP